MSKKSILIILFSALCVMVAQISKAAVINVTTTHDNVPGSLRAAITTANTNGEDNTIYLPVGAYILSGAADENGNVRSGLNIYTGHNLTIIGARKTQTFIDGNHIDRVLSIFNGTVTITDLTIRRGKVPSWSYYNEDGGGIYNYANLTLTRCVIKENVAGNGFWRSYDIWPGGNGGGIYNGGVLTLNKCIIMDNKAGNGASSRRNGSDGGNGGGIDNQGTLILNNCTITGNSAGIGGAGHNDDGFDGNGGGICNRGTLTMFGCTVCDNVCGLYGGVGGGIINTNTDSYLNMTACTISGNLADAGGGLYNGGNSQLISVTVTYNKGTGISNQGSISLKNSIAAKNTSGYYGNGTDCFGTFNWVSYSLIEDTSGCNLTGFQKANILWKDPLLGPLKNNGGFTYTHALLPGSPAIDAGNRSGISVDQRGYQRPINIPGIANVSDGADIGAYEYESSLSYYNISGKITYNDIALPGVILTFSDEGGTTSTDTGGNYSHSVPFDWSGTVTPSKTGYSFVPSSKSYYFISSNQANQDYTAASLIPPNITLNKTQLNFGADTTGKQTPSQSFLISNSGGGTLNWTAGDNADWLNCNPTSGIGPAMITVSIDTSALSPGDYTGMITIADPNAVNSPQTVKVKLIVYDTGSAQPPFGSFDTPLSGSTVTGSIPVTGWAIDNIGLESVKIYRNATAAGSSEFVYIGDAIFVEGARPDIETLYPDYPNSYKAGWGYLLLTNALPDQGNGNFTLYARATNKEGNTVTLGSKTITCDNANAVKPFGAIDTPAQGGPVSGNNYVNFGWALTPLPNTILTNGSTITVWVNGVPLGHPVYNENRPDVAALFPNYNNSDGAGGHFLLNTSNYPNGVHTIAWTVSDNAGNADGIGSRYFTIQNTGGDLFRRGAAAFSAWSPVVDAGYAVSGQYGAVRVKKGFNPDIEANEVYPDEEGVIHIEIQELERVEIHLSPGTINVSPLPIGSTMDSREGIFYWQPGPGFIGQYRLVFEEKEGTGPVNRKEVVVTICPISLKFSSAWSSIDCGKR